MRPLAVASVQSSVQGCVCRLHSGLQQMLDLLQQPGLVEPSLPSSCPQPSSLPEPSARQLQASAWQAQQQQQQQQQQLIIPTPGQQVGTCPYRLKLRWRSCVREQAQRMSGSGALAQSLLCRCWPTQARQQLPA